MTQDFQIAAFAGDGVGHEVTPVAKTILDAAAARCGFALKYQDLQGGAQCWRDTGHEIPPADYEAAGKADAILLAAMGLPDIRYNDGREITPQISIRFHFDLYAGVRNVIAILVVLVLQVTRDNGLRERVGWCQEGGDEDHRSDRE